MSTPKKITKTYKYFKLIDPDNITKHTIAVANLSFIINLKKTNASSYLNFMVACMRIKKDDTNKIITSRKIKNNYLIIEISMSSNQSSYAKSLCDILIEYNIDFIAIDELFPHENSYLLKRNDCPNTKIWAVKIFTPTTSKVIVS